MKRMNDFGKKIFGCKLCWIVTSTLFVAMVITSFLIMIPAYYIYRDNLIKDFKNDNLVVVQTLFQLNDPKKNKIAFTNAAERIVKQSNINGAIVYDKKGAMVVKFGNIKPVTPVQLEALLTNPNSELQKQNVLAFWGGKDLGEAYDVIATLDKSKIDATMQSFLFTYIDEMLIVALIITLVALVLMNRLVLKPILQASKQLKGALDQPVTPKQFMIKTIPRNELGHIFAVYNALLKKINDYIKLIKQKRKALQNLNATLEIKVKKRTQELTKTNLQLKKEITERMEISNELKMMASFPSENINPVLRISSGGIILYANIASQPLLQLWRSKVSSSLPSDWVGIIKSLLEENIAKSLEIKCEQTYYLLNLVPNVEQKHVNIYAINISDRKEYEDKLRYLSGHDPITDLINLRLFEELMLQAAKNLEINYFIGVISLEINDFRKLSQSLGHRSGDILLKQLSARLKDGLPSQFLFSHAGSNHFLIGMSDLEEAHTAGNYATDILNLISKPFNLPEQNVHIAINMGIAFYPIDANTITELIKNADLAMFHARAKGQNQYQYFKETMNKDLEIRHRLYQDLHVALAKKQFYFEYQPQLNLKTRKISGVEALIRWRHPELGRIQPENFIDILEQSHMMDSLTFWLLNTAAQQHLTWLKLKLPPIRISVNLTGSQLNHPKLIEILTDLLTRENINPEYLEIEITERTAIADIKSTSKILNKISQLGFSIAVDDFGTDYSSLQYLQELPINKIKIDKSFLIDLNMKKEKAVIIDAMIKLAHNLQIKVTCEGIENSQQIAYLLKQDCDEIQGYFISEPLSAKHFASFIKCDTKVYFNH